MENFEKVNQSNIFLYHVIEKLIFLQIHNILENPQIANMNSDFVLERVWKTIPTICTPQFAVYFAFIQLT